MKAPPVADTSSGAAAPTPGPAPQSDTGPRPPPVRLASPKVAASRAETTRRMLLHELGADPEPDERVLLELAVDEVELYAVLQEAQLQVAIRMSHFVDNPSHVVALARALKNASDVATAVTARVREALLAASTLRTQRQLTKHSAR
jgi:hypothetical protein